MPSSQLEIWDKAYAALNKIEDKTQSFPRQKLTIDQYINNFRVLPRNDEQVLIALKYFQN